MFERKSDRFFLCTLISVVLFALMISHALYRQLHDRDLIQRKADLVQRIGLTDLCLFTDARYTRHPSMTDSYSPFQDFPMALDHFPSASMVDLPPHLRSRQ